MTLVGFVTRQFVRFVSSHSEVRTSSFVVIVIDTYTVIAHTNKFVVLPQTLTLIQ